MENLKRGNRFENREESVVLNVVPILDCPLTAIGFSSHIIKFDA